MVINRTKLRVEWPVSTIFSLCTLLFCCSARDVITPSLPIRGALNETIVSAGQVFELGFFPPPGSSKRYLGIWHYRSRIMVWVANRWDPLVGNDGVFGMGEDGNLHVFEDSGKPIWSTGLKTTSSMNLTAKLMDSGNLVLINMDPSSPLWQSFDYPTDTFLPGMKFNESMNLTSWKGPDDPESGDFYFMLDPEGGKNEYVVKNRSIFYWKSEFSSSDEILPEIIYMLTNFSKSDIKLKQRNKRLRMTSNYTQLIQYYSNSRLVLNYTGEIQYWWWNEKYGWLLRWRGPRNRCSVFNACGRFGVCNFNSNFGCKCLPGFVPDSPENWNSQDFSGGCKRKSEHCEKSFLSLKMMKVGTVGSPFQSASNETECRNECLNGCKCLAYSYDADDSNEGGFQRQGSRSSSCTIWSDDLKNLEENSNGGLNLSVRVALSDIASTSRSCDTCGTNMIPYPLSTGPNCGDPLYFSFDCNNNTGQVTFRAPSGATYQVTRVNPDAHNFVIQINGSNNCTSGISSRVDNFNFLQLNQSSPFYVTTRCNAENETEIAWKPAREPTCRSSTDCRDWPHSTCNGTGNGKRCLCSTNFKWNASLLNCTEGDLHPLLNGYSKSLIVGLTIASAIVLLNTVVFLYIWRRKVAKKQENSENIQGNLAHRFYGSERRLKQLMDSGEFTKEDKKDIDVPYFDFESILAATDSFSDVNKLGQGGYGPVYKGTFPGDHEIAVKRLLSVSGQGLQEFKNEVVLIAKLQHRNLVKLLGYCLKGDEKILLYEYMPNKSLDSFIFDNTQSLLLDWNMRFNIILGIARGLLYLHQDSRLRVIHRDLKTSNILLDEEMNPKISDFGLARIVGGKQIEASTNRIVGTYGYMSPEYALEGLFSVKSDVFSFGVVVLEIISGKKNTGFNRSHPALSLLGYTWKLWKEEKLLDLMDPILCQTYNTDEFLRCISVGLLCVQEDPSDRPTMSNVLFMLGSDAATLPTPKQPAFVVRRGLSSTPSSSSKPDTIPEITSTSEEGR